MMSVVWATNHQAPHAKHSQKDYLFPSRLAVALLPHGELARPPPFPGLSTKQMKASQEPHYSHTIHYSVTLSSFLVQYFKILHHPLTFKVRSLSFYTLPCLFLLLFFPVEDPLKSCCFFFAMEAKISQTCSFLLAFSALLHAFFFASKS